MGLRPDQAAALGLVVKAATTQPPTFRDAVAGVIRQVGAQAEALAKMQPKKKPARVAAGRRARATGERTEDALDAQHSVYSAQKLAYVVRLPTPMRVLGAVTRGQCRAVFERRSSVDYLGVVLPGRAVAVELKRRAGKRLAVDDVEPHQWHALAEVERMGGLALVVVVLDTGAWACRASRMRADADERGAKSWTDVDLGRCGARLRGLDWLAAVAAEEG